MNKERIKEISEEYDVSTKQLKEYLARIVEHDEVDLGDDDRILECLEYVASERSSINNSKESEYKAHSLIETINCAVANVYGYGIPNGGDMTKEQALISVVQNYGSRVSKIIK